MYGESKVGTEATINRDDETAEMVLVRDDRACLVCGSDEEVTVVKRNKHWRMVPENLYTVCSGICSIQRETSLAEANGWTLRDHYGIGDRPFLTRAGWKWLGHGANILSERPRQWSQ